MSRIDRRSSVLLAAAVAVVVVVVAVVVTLGVERPPPVAALGDGALVPSSGVATTRWDGGQTCLETIAVDGSRQQVWCTRDGVDLVAWTDEGLVVQRWEERGLTLEVLDLTDGSSLRTVAISARDEQRLLEQLDGPPPARTSWSAGELTVSSRDGTVLWRTAAPERYDLFTLTPSPDARLLAGVDRAGRLLVLDATGEQDPVVWTDGLEPWSRLVWEGGAAPEVLTTDG